MKRGKQLVPSITVKLNDISITKCKQHKPNLFYLDCFLFFQSNTLSKVEPYT